LIKWQDKPVANMHQMTADYCAMLASVYAKLSSSDGFIYLQGMRATDKVFSTRKHQGRGDAGERAVTKEQKPDG
jgi:hypothetical protein